MFLQWGFDEKGITLVYCSTKASTVDFTRDDVYTVYIDETTSEENE